jgi:hypothetical protein
LSQQSAGSRRPRSHYLYWHGGECTSSSFETYLGFIRKTSEEELKTRENREQEENGEERKRGSRPFKDERKANSWH